MFTLKCYQVFENTASDKKTVMVGDLNAHSISWNYSKNDVNGSGIADILNDHDLVLVIIIQKLM